MLYRHIFRKASVLRKTNQNLLKKQKLGLNVKALASNNNLKLGFRRALIIPKSIFGGYLLLSLLGYQPVWGIPPVQKKSIEPVFAQATTISSSNIPITFQLPHPGYLTTPFSSYHPGVDIATGLGMPIRPIADGTVVDIKYELFGLGHHVYIQHQDGYESVYGHMGRIFVQVGQNVTTSTILGEVGLTGNTTGPHTHLEILKDGKFIDPQSILPKITPIYDAAQVPNQTALPIGYVPSLSSPRSLSLTSTENQDKNIDFRTELSFNL